MARRGGSRAFSRRQLLGASAGVATAALLPGAVPVLPPAAITAERRTGQPPFPADPAQADDPLFRQLDEKIVAGMARYRIPGVAVGVVHQGREYLRGYGVTNVDYPQAVDADTLFRIGSTTKTFTGTTVMRLVEQGLLDLDAPVITYLPRLRLADASVASRVTVRQLLNHSAGWVGDDFADFGRGSDALAKYVAGMQQLPQLTPPGQVFAYNNAAVNLAGYLIAVVTNKPYEEVVQSLLLEPLGLDHTGFYTDHLVGYSLAASHVVQEDRTVVGNGMWAFPEGLNPTGGLISSARDQIRFARFHLGDGTTDAGAALLQPQSLQAMRSNLGPGGTIQIEIDGIGVNWWQRRTAEGVPVYQHGGSWQGQYSGFFFLPERGFAMTMLTNSTGGPRLITDVFFTDWALQLFAGLSDPPAEPRPRPAAELAAYEGLYRGWVIPPGGPPDRLVEVVQEIRTDGGGLRVNNDGDEQALVFYRDDHVLVTNGDGEVFRADFIRSQDGRVAWFRTGGRIFQHLD